MIATKILKKSEFQKEDNINNLTKQTLFDHLNNVAMSSNSNTQSARVNAGCNTIENQLGKQHVTKLFKNLQEELDIDSAAKEVAEMLKNYRCKKVPAPLHTSGIGDRTETLMVMVMTLRKAMTVMMTMNLTRIIK